jgi:hypothetical protein
MAVWCQRPFASLAANSVESFHPMAAGLHTRWCSYENTWILQSISTCQTYSRNSFNQKRNKLWKLWHLVACWNKLLTKFRSPFCHLFLDTIQVRGEMHLCELSWSAAQQLAPSSRVLWPGWHSGMHLQMEPGCQEDGLASAINSLNQAWDKLLNVLWQHKILKYITPKKMEHVYTSRMLQIMIYMIFASFTGFHFVTCLGLL